MKLSLIVAADEQDTIGREGGLPWHFPDDLKRFKALTVGHVVIAGRLTQDSMVARLGRPLPDRTTLVVTRSNSTVDIEGVQYVPDLATALERALELTRPDGRSASSRAEEDDEEVFVIGGAQIYEAALPLVQTVHLTRVQGTFDGDVEMPAGWLTPFELVAREERDGYAWETYQRRSYYYLENSRGDAQSDDMRRLEAEGRCLFCPGQEPLAVLHKTPQWTIVPNRFPYRGTRLHLLLVPDEHVTDMADLSPAARDDFWTALGWVRDRYGLTYYGLAVRNGDPRFTGGTIRHLHLHVVVGDVENPEADPVRVKLSSRPSV
jgi:dihydrofolate reductase/diadenosine tetraphosphate (Ap4A) HIT family hydrolase